MFFFIRWGRRTTEQKVNAGSFRCPRCETQQSCKHIRCVKQSHLYWIPLGNGENQGEWLVCDTCKSRYPAEQYIFDRDTKTFKTQTWDCGYCGHINPNTTYRCRSCDRSLI
jgi:hypothetical protein